MGRISHAWKNVRGYGSWILFVTSALVAAGGWFYHRESARIQAAKFEELGSIAQLKARQVREWRRELKSDVERSTHSPYFRDAARRWFAAQQDGAFTATFLERLRVEVDVDFYVDVLLLRPNCTFELSLNGNETELPPESAEACRRAVASGESVIGDLFKQTDGSIGLDVIAPLCDRDGHPFGALGLRSDARSYLFPLLSSWPTASQSAETALVQRQGEAVLLLSEMRAKRGGAALTPISPLSSDASAARAARGSVGHVRAADYRGVDVLADLRRVPDSPWIMITKEDASEILAEAQFRAGVSIIAVAVVLLLAAASLCFGYKYQQQVSRRVVLEVQAARLRLLQLPSGVSVESLLERAIEEAMQLTGSPQGFFDTFAADESLELRVALPKASMQTPDPSASDRPGTTAHLAWPNDIRGGRHPVEGSGAGNVPYDSPRREAFAPVVREGKIVAALGVSNRRQRYTEDDRATLYPLAELTWDIIARRRTEAQRASLEEQLRVAQRMEAIGRLAGGVAHDFNNLLLVIQSCSEFLLEDLPDGDPRRDDVQEIRSAGERAASLTRQLLAFSRKQMLLPSVFDLNEVLDGLVESLERLVGEVASIRIQKSEGPLLVKADRSQIEQVITSLVANARDATSNGGAITIETRACTEEAAATERADRELSGPCAVLMVSDTGSGMDDEVKSKIFEPFFSTKTQGKGTGLGLATVYGVVRQSGGCIFVSSTKGQGTSFKICLPMTAEASKAGVALSSATPKGTEKVLLVEDNPSVREQIQRILTRAGYDVTTACSGEEVMAFTRKRLGEFALAISDVVMPGIGGCELAERLLGMQPELMVLLMSGYTDQSDALAGGLGPRLHFISKPFGADVLARKVREMLNGVPSASAASAQ